MEIMSRPRSILSPALCIILATFTLVDLAISSPRQSSNRAARARRRLPAVSVTTSVPTVSAGGSTQFFVRTSKVDPFNNISINYLMTGTAVAGQDYVPPSGSVTIPAGAVSASISITTMATASPTSRVATLRLQNSAGYKVSTPSRSSVTIRPAIPTPTPTPSPTPSPSSTPTPTPSPTPTVTPVPKQEVWVSLRNDGLAGTGTQTDPFDGTTQSRFDAVMAAIPPNSAIHLGPGTFRTAVARPWLVKPGWSITGGGMDVTIVQLAGNASAITSVSCFSSDPNISTDNVTISDLTIDCNWPELSQTAVIGSNGESKTAVAASYIFGSNNVIERVHFMNAYGSWGNLNESFGIAFASPLNADATNNIIRNCRADFPHGNYGAPFALHGRVGHPINNSAILSNTATGINDGLTNGFSSGGANLAYHQNCLVADNTFIDCFGIAYQDTGTLKNLTVRNNTAVRAWYGVGVTLMNSAWTADGVSITNNNINIQNRCVGAASYGVVFGGNVTVVTNVLVDGNVFTSDITGLGLNDIQPVADLWKLNNVNARIRNNLTDANCISRIRSAGVCLFNNRLPDGRQSFGLEDNSATPCP